MEKCTFRLYGEITPPPSHFDFITGKPLHGEIVEVLQAFFGKLDDSTPIYIDITNADNDYENWIGKCLAIDLTNAADGLTVAEWFLDGKVEIAFDTKHPYITKGASVLMGKQGSENLCVKGIIRSIRESYV